VTTASSQTPVIWRISDGRPGHDSQSKGLVKALNLIKPCNCHDIKLADSKPGLLDLLFKKFPDVNDLPDPDMIIGAGHETHLPLLCAKRARGGKTIIIMKPSIPASCFDICFIPEHDAPKIADNILATKGAINCISPSTEQADDLGLILIGGPSRHFYWDEEYLLQQLNEILTTHTDIKWEISDSSRTPETTSDLLAALQYPNAEYKSCSSKGPAWVARRLNLVANVWASMDSVSMVYEALTSGAAVGLLDVPLAGTSKVSNNIAGLVEDKMLTPYSKWLSDRKLVRPPVSLNEAKRCAEQLHEAGLLH
jgi:mitochondrial fission protein ELM1